MDIAVYFRGSMWNIYQTHIPHTSKERNDLMKKQFSLFVAVVMLMTALFSAVSVKADFSDVAADYRYKDAITTLSKLNVINGYENGTFEPEKDITRAEFTKIIVYMLGYGDLTEPITQFNDVSADHWANPNIKVAYDLGIINGFDEVTFKPDEPVTYEQALKMLVCTLGYQSLAEQSGGYPQGYISQAAALSLTDGVADTAFTDNASRGVVTQIMYNALEVAMYEQTATGWQASDKTLLNDYLGVYVLKGTVVGVEDSTTADCNAKLYAGQMAVKDMYDEEYVIDYTEYTDSYATMSAFLGNTVKVYYRQDKNSDDRWLVEIDNETYSNTEVTVYSYNIDSYSGTSFKYYLDDSSRSQTAKLNSADLTVRYNGRAVTGNVYLGDTAYAPLDALNEWLNPDSDNFIYGTVKLIDSGSKGSYNIVDIYDYDTIVAYKTPSSSDYKITDKTVTGNYIILDPDDVDYKFTITKNDSEIKTTNIAANDVLNYAVSLDGELYTVYDTAKSVTGTITATSIEGSGEKTISIDGTQYRVTERFLKYMQDKEQKEIKTGMSITAYLDILGSLEWGTVSSSTSFYPYAYVIDAVTEGEDYYLRLFAPSNTSITSFSSSTSYKVKTYKLAAKPKLNGSSSNAESILDALAESAETANPDTEIANLDVKLTGYNQLIKVGFNDASEITNVVTINSTDGTVNTDNGNLVRYKAIDPEKKYYVSSTAVKESSTGSTFYSIRSSTPLFVIPKDRTDTDSYSLKSAVTSNSMVSGSSYYVEAFDLNDSKYPSCVLVYNTNFKSGTTITKSTLYRLVADDIEEVYDADEDDVFKNIPTYFSSTSLSNTNISPSANFSDVGMGDIILMGLDSDNYADTYIKVQDYDEIKRILNGETVTYESADGETKTATYYWNETQEQTEDNNWQLYKFDWRYPKASVSEPTDSYFETGGNVTNIFSRAAMFNVIQVLSDDNKIYVTKNGFDESGVLDESEYEEIKVSSSTKYIRYDSAKDEFTPYAEGTDSTNITLTDLKEAKNFGSDCSKVLITYTSSTSSSSSVTPTARLVVIYD